MPVTYAGYTGTAANANLDALWLKAGLSVTDAQFGADPTGTTDSTTAFRLAYAYASAQAQALGGYAEVVIPYGNFAVTGNIPVTWDRVVTRCLGSITFTPTGDAELFTIRKVDHTQIIAYVKFYNMNLIGGGSRQKTAFGIYDSSQILIEDTVLSSWVGNGGNAANPSTGIWTHGREFCTVNRFQAAADRPIYFDVNANSATLCTDHFHYSNLYLLTQDATQYGITSATGVVHSSLTIDGRVSLIGGKGGINFKPGSVTNSAVIVIGGLRYEQAVGASGWAIDSEMALTGLTVRDSHLGGTAAPSCGGIKLRRTSVVVLENVTYEGAGGAVAVDCDSTCDAVEFVGCFFQETAVVTMTGSAEMLGLPKLGSASPIGVTSLWKNTGIGTPASLRINDTNVDYQTDLLLGVGATSPTLTMGTGGVALKVATLTVSGSSADATIHEGGIVTVNAAAAKLIAGTTDFAATNTASKLCILWLSSSSVQILNNTAKALNVVVSAVWVR